MKAIILAAGQGTRLRKYATDLPKAMLEFAGKTLLQRQLDTLRGLGIDEVIVVTGYGADAIPQECLTIHNPDYAETNMVESLFCAERAFDDELVVSYGDIIYEPRILSGLLEAKHDIVVTVDAAWQRYWELRYGDTSVDVESLELNPDGTIRALGVQGTDASRADARYVGLLSLSRTGVENLQEVYHEERRRFWGRRWKTSGRVFQQAYMTDMLQALIDAGHPVHTHRIAGGSCPTSVTAMV